MSPAQTDRIVVTISSTDDKVTFNLEGQILRFAGFLEVTNDATDDVILPEMKVQQQLPLLEANIAEKFSKPPARFSEASLVQNLEEQGDRATEHLCAHHQHHLRPWLRHQRRR